MSQFKLEFTLRQHTPLIHFQHGQDGATLRVTEIRSKLDRFLIRRVFQNNLSEFKDFLVGADQEKAKKLLQSETPYQWSFEKRLAFNYQIKVQPGSPKPGFRPLAITTSKGKFVTDQDKFPVILGNMGGKETKEELKNLVLFDDFKVSFQSFHPDLLAKIKEYFPKLLALENFGNRNGKGFGSFTCEKIDGQKASTPIPFPYHFSCNVQTNKVERDLPNNEFERQRSLFSIIDIFYKSLRSGINYSNFRGFYFKSLLFRYADEKLKEQWDKRTIKERYFVSNATAYATDHRDLLGFSTVEAWKFDENGREINAEVTKESKEMERFKSPIVFKPIRTSENTFEVYFKIMPIPADIRNAKILVQRDGSGDLQLTPSKTFNLQAFLDYVFDEVDLVEHVEKFDKKEMGCAENDLFVKTIQPIYDSILKNLGKNQ